MTNKTLHRSMISSFATVSDYPTNPYELMMTISSFSPTNRFTFCVNGMIIINREWNQFKRPTIAVYRSYFTLNSNEHSFAFHAPVCI